ncbi:phage late control D family protein [Geobacillus kaustophilus]|uniref:phage late control D family protein n=1 Tax=Geobacillus kaustophilus TaxID=1462 RepID=UPI0005CD0DC4|nr:contractile injection system protein, VgrG/Pvc8 family [Geobacillus kaustophilus]
MANARRAYISLKYNNQKLDTYIHPFLKEWTITDNLSGAADDLEVLLEDTQKLWRGSWMPSEGALLTASIISQNWYGDEKTETKPMGLFEIDEISLKYGEGFRIAAISLPESGSLRGQQKSRSWEKTKLKTVFADIAKANNMKLQYNSDENPDIDRVEQASEQDIKFLMRLCQENGLSLKISNKTIVVMDEAKYEKAAAQATIQPNDPYLVDYEFTKSLNGKYRAAKVEYRDPSKKKTIRYTFTPPNSPKVGRILVINEQVKSTAEAMKLAKKKLREANKDANTASFIFSGIKNYYSGMTVNVNGFGNFDGKYIITRTRFSGSSSGTATSIELRKCLEGY